MNAIVVQHDFSLLEAFSDRIETAVAHTTSPQTLLHSVVDVAQDTRRQLEGLVSFDDESKLWSFTSHGCEFLRDIHESNERLQLLIYGFLFGYYIASDPKITINPIAIPENDDDEDDEIPDDKSITYYAYYSLLSKKHTEINNEIENNQSIIHGSDFDRLVTDIFGYDVLARQYRKACIHKADVAILNDDLLQAIDTVADATLLFETDLLHIVLGVYISAAL